MNWTPVTSFGSHAAQSSRMRFLRKHPESTDLSRSYRVGSGLVRENSSRGSVRLFSRCKISLSPLPATSRTVRADREEAGGHFRKRKWAYSAQFWCNLSPLDATLLSLLLCVANKELAQHLSPLDATFTKNIGGGGQTSLSSFIFNPYFLTSLPPYFHSRFSEAHIRA
jgi:hypothetical protein